MQPLKPVLLVEDDNVDAMTVKRAMRDLHVGHSVMRSVNGEEAMKYLTNPDNEKPFVILLDLNMPKMNGMEFLKVIKAHPELKTIPIIVLTTSREKRDVLESFELGAAGYMVKPVDYSKFVETLGSIMMYWSTSELPKPELITAEINRNLNAPF
ncbi:MAG: response regulator [Sedimentisphaerales bacterium]|jgi:CheY-like chemotaxis protein